MFFARTFYTIITKINNRFFYIKLTEEEIEQMDFDYNTVVLHGRSYSVIEEIAEFVGRERFDLILKDILSEYAHKSISFPLFSKFIAERTGIDIGYFVEEYLHV